MLFHVDMIYLAKQAKKLYFQMRPVTKSNPERSFISFMSKRRKYTDVLPILAQNEHFTHGMNITALIRTLDVKNQTDHVL